MPPRSESRRFDLVLTIGLPLILALLIWNVVARRRGGQEVPVGTPLPAIDAQGWLNVPDGAPFDPAGKLLVVDLWATWCGPCIRGLPEFARIAAAYRPLGVAFLGVTQESERDRQRIEQVIQSTPGFDWPVAYGAVEFMNSLPIRGIPTVILFGRDGKAVWSGIGSYGLEAALDDVLARDAASKDAA